MDGLRRRLGSAAQWTGVGLVGLYAAFAVVVGLREVLVVLDVLPPDQPRAFPPLFAVHALTGAVALAAGALQLRLGRPRSAGRARLHRLMGYHYVGAALATSILGPVVAVRFDVGPVGTLVFLAWAGLWATATVVAVRRARAGRIATHRRWMTRSYALALVFVVFDFARSALAGTGLDREAVYPLALGSTVLLNLALCEAWLRRRLSRGSAAARTALPGDRAASPSGPPPARRTPAR